MFKFAAKQTEIVPIKLQIPTLGKLEYANQREAHGTLILDGISDIGTQVRSDLGYSICVRH